MSGTGRTLSFGIVVEDSQHWTPEHHMAAVAADDVDSYDDWVTGQLEAVMRKAGEAFVAQHPDLFRVQEIL